ncbi:MAG: sigma-70 family RNA polymerase sigma factor [Clostridiales bacterium]|nr:sigma-70 family RNA polymerase sigma factor [Clostridiales bacterium]
MHNEELTRQLNAIRNGDMAAFETLYNDSRTPVYTIILRITWDRAMSEDILQEFFTKLFISPPKPSVQNPRAYLFQMARNLAIDSVRKQVPQVPLEESSAYQPLDDSPLRMDIESALKRLPAQDCQIVTLHVIGELKFRELSEIMQIPIGTVLWKYGRAIGKLQKYLSGDLQCNNNPVALTDSSGTRPTNTDMSDGGGGSKKTAFEQGISLLILAARIQNAHNSGVVTNCYNALLYVLGTDAGKDAKHPGVASGMYTDNDYSNRAIGMSDLLDGVNGDMAKWGIEYDKPVEKLSDASFNPGDVIAVFAPIGGGDFHVIFSIDGKRWYESTRATYQVHALVPQGAVERYLDAAAGIYVFHP